MNILQQHFRDQRQTLLAQYRASKILKSSKNLGNVRELFVRNFLANHLPKKINYGQGEIIDATGQQTGEIDIVLYHQDSPVLSVGGSDVFLCEGVYAAIEVKSNLSNLKDEEIVAAIDKLIKVNNLRRKPENFLAPRTKEDEFTSLHPIDFRPRSYLVAFEGPKMKTLRKKLEAEYLPRQMMLREMPDLIVVLNRGFICKNDKSLPAKFEARPGKEQVNYIAFDAPKDCLLVLFMHLLRGLTRFSLAFWDYSVYLPKGEPE